MGALSGTVPELRIVNGIVEKKGALHLECDPTGITAGPIARFTRVWMV
jgi:hypothetical protein